MTPANDQIAAGITQQFEATGAYSDGTTRDLTAQVTWASATIADGDHLHGRPRHGRPGGLDGHLGDARRGGRLRAAHRVAARRYSASRSPGQLSIAAGTTQQFAATGHFNNGDAQDVTQQATWASSTPATATIGATGLATAVAAGTTTISAALSGVTGTTTLTVTPHTLQSIQVTPASPQLRGQPDGALQGDRDVQRQLDAGPHRTGDLELFLQAVATVAATGIVSSVSPGTSTITAAFSGVTGTTPVTVDRSILTEHLVTPVDPTIPVNGTLQMTATGHFSDGDTHDVTTQASWTTDPAGAVTISATGLADRRGGRNAAGGRDAAGVSGGTNLTVAASPAIPDAAARPGDLLPDHDRQPDHRQRDTVLPAHREPAALNARAS